MKKNAHPKYQQVLFVDTSTGQKYLCGTTLKTEEKEMHDGKEYPACRVAVSSSSHPFFVGGKGIVDTEGRVDKFNKRYQAAQQKNQDKKDSQDDSDKKEGKEKKKKK